MKDFITTYQQRYDSFLQRIAMNLEQHVSGLTEGMLDLDHLSARAKDPGSFAEKAARTDENDLPKYQNPLTEIQDQVGVRIVVFYKHTVPQVVTTVHKYFRGIEEKELVPESFWEFGYFGRHLVLALPADVIPPDVDPEEAPRFFELQIKTLFQHAWSQANHDLGYKAPKELSGEHQRHLAFTAAQAWGADRSFEELHSELA